MRPYCAKLLGVVLVGVLAGHSQAADLIEDEGRVLSFQAGLTDGQGVPLSGPHTLTFNIYDDPINPVALPGGGPFDINVNIPAEAGGVVSVILPDDGTGLDASLFSGAALYLGLAIGIFLDSCRIHSGKIIVCVKAISPGNDAGCQRPIDNMRGFTC